MNASRLVLLVQLPIPPLGPGPIEGNVPLAAAYLKLFARRRGLETSYSIDLLPATLANRLGDRALIDAILARRPWMVGFTCYVWNIDRTLWIAEQLKLRQPELIVLLGGPEVTDDNQRVLHHPAVDYAVTGEGEETFARLLANLAADGDGDGGGFRHSTLPREKTTAENLLRPPQAATRERLPDPQSTSSHPNPLPNSEATPIELDEISSPYGEGILDLGDGGRMSLETARGCRYRCRYCYYPKSHHGLRFLSPEQVLANLNYAVEHGAKEVVLLDPTLNQRPDFADFLRLLRRGNPTGSLTFSGELRAEGIDGQLAQLLRDANFHEVEIGLQSVEPKAWELMGRLTDLAAFERGVKAIIAEGITARVDLILGLPGDTVDSVRRGIDFLLHTGAYTETQIFNLSILPGTAFRRQAEQLGLRYQPWPPYYVLQTPTLDMEDIFQLMEEAEEAFGVEFDAMPPPQLDTLDPQGVCRVDLDATENALIALPLSPTLAFTLWLCSADFPRRTRKAIELIERLLADNPHTTLQVVFEPTGDPERLTPETLEFCLAACYRKTTYLDRFYSLQPGQLLGSKRLVVLLPPDAQTSEAWQSRVSEFATVVS